MRRAESLHQPIGVREDEASNHIHQKIQDVQFEALKLLINLVLNEGEEPRLTLSPERLGSCVCLTCLMCVFVLF